MTQKQFTNRYQFNIKTSKIGGGSFGTVYKAYDTVRDREVAVKISEVKQVGDKEFSLQEEFAAVKDLPEHKNIAFYEDVFTFETFQGVYDYAIMQYYSAGNLSEYLKQTTLSTSEKEAIIFQILDGIAHLHNNGVVHRDLKPSNILIVKRGDQIIPKITDFGLSKKTETKGLQFTNSFAGGTIQYSSPEQLKGLPLHLNTDLWSFGVIAYEIIAGNTLFDFGSQTASAEAEQHIVNTILNGDLKQLLSTVPKAWETTIKSCLERNPNNRVQDAAAIKSLYYKNAKNQEPTKSSTTEILIKTTPSKEILTAETLVKENNPQKEVAVPKETATKPKRKLLPYLLIAGLLLCGIGGYFGYNFYQVQQEEKAWQKALSTNTIDAYTNFTNTFNASQYVILATESSAWLKTAADSTVGSINNFKTSYPNSSFSLKADSLLKELTWLKLKEIGAKQAYLDFKDKTTSALSKKQIDSILKTLTWDKTFGGKDSDTAHSVIQTQDGGYLVAGNTGSKGNGDFDFWVIKLAQDGTIAWDKTFGGKKSDYAQSIIQTQDGGYLVAGHTRSKGKGLADIWLIKLAADGSKLWDKTFGGKSLDLAFSVIETQDSGFFVVGRTRSKGNGGEDIWSIKLTVDGTKVWDKTFGGNRYDTAQSVIQTLDGGYLVAGHTLQDVNGYSGDNTYSNIWLIKLSENGTKIWDKIFGGTYTQQVSELIQTLDGSFIVTGLTWSKDNGTDILVIKLEKDGTIVWEKKFGGKDSDRANSVIQTQDGGYLVAGNTGSKGNGDFDFWVIKLAQDGTIAWDKTFGGKNSDIAESVIQTLDGGFVVVGSTESKGNGNYDIWVLKLDKEGNL